MGDKILKNNSTVALNVCCEKEKEIYPAYILKYNSTHEKNIEFLMILNGHYLAVTKLSALLRGITSKHQRYFYCLNCLHFATQN